MRRVILCLVCFILLPPLVLAQRKEEERRIEEKKWKSLKPTEVKIEKELPHISLPKELKPLPLLSLLEKAYFAELATRPVAYRYDICKAIVVLMGEEEEYTDLGAQITYLRANKLLPKRYHTRFDPMKPLRKGLMTYTFHQALRIKGGVILRAFGPSERYSLKELVYQGITSEGTTGELVSGEELITTLANAANYKAKVAAERK